MVLVTALGYASKLNCGLPPKKGKCLYTGNIMFVVLVCSYAVSKGAWN